MKEPVAGWFKLLAQEEGEFYSIPVPSEEGLRIHMKPGMGLVGREALLERREYRHRRCGCL